MLIVFLAAVLLDEFLSRLRGEHSQFRMQALMAINELLLGAAGHLFDADVNRPLPGTIGKERELQ